jgi:hypothetical protein
MMDGVDEKDRVQLMGNLRWYKGRRKVFEEEDKSNGDGGAAPKRRGRIVAIEVPFIIFW